MFDPDRVLIDQVVDKLEADFRSACAPDPPEGAARLAAVGRRALGTIARCDALYHNVHHTILVTLVANDILRGKLETGHPISPRRWRSFVASALCHDIGFVRNICRADRNGHLATGIGDGTFELESHQTDASMAPYHVDRSVLYVRETFGDDALFDADAMTANIERTRFPVPEDDEHRTTDDDPGLLRAADLLGQVAGTHVDRRYPALFYEFEETGVNEHLGFDCPRDLMVDFPRFYSKVIVRYCGPAMGLLETTPDGQNWLANLHAHLAASEGGPRRAD